MKTEYYVYVDFDKIEFLYQTLSKFINEYSEILFFNTVLYEYGYKLSLDSKDLAYLKLSLEDICVEPVSVSDKIRCRPSMAMSHLTLNKDKK